MAVRMENLLTIGRITGGILVLAGEFQNRYQYLTPDLKGLQLKGESDDNKNRD